MKWFILAIALGLIARFVATVIKAVWDIWKNWGKDDDIGPFAW